MPRRQHISVEHDFPVPVDRLFAHLAEHENLGKLFAPAKVVRLRDGASNRNGAGSARSVKPGPLPAFVETVTDYRENELIEYRITKGGLLKNHLGQIRFFRLDAGSSRVAFNIVFEGKAPGVGSLFRLIISRGIRKGLLELADNKTFARVP